MDLVERAGVLTFLQTQLDSVAEGEGHCVFVSGEAGIGKTALVKAFCKQQNGDCTIYQGACDDLFTPRPLAPLYDIMWQARSDLLPNNLTMERSALFATFFQELRNQKKKVLLIFEDIHWADEATLDFIKFFARRIAQTHCLFILTYRDDEIHSRHPLRNVLGQLPPDSFTKLVLTPLSRQAVEKMAAEKGYSGEDVYSISGGNPFYVNEILASYSLGIPDTIKDAILSVFNNLEAKTREIWELMSVIPTSFETKHLEKLEPFYATSIEHCLEVKVILLKDGHIGFKHELYRRTIENSLSPLKRVSLHKRILELLQESFEQNGEIERIIHHAKNANAYETVVYYAPLGAKQAASVGAHTEAARLYLSAIEYDQGSDSDTLIQLYEAYAYECYLTNQIKEAIIYTERTLKLLKEKNDKEKLGSCMRFLSRLWWFDGNTIKAEAYANQAVGMFNNLPSSRAKAMAYSNMSQLKMLSDETEACIHWGEKAIAMAKEVNDEEIICHALNNIGTSEARTLSTRKKGIELLKQSLEIALKNSYQEHAARAYTNLGNSAVVMKDYAFAKEILDEGIQYGRERDIDSWTTFLFSERARTYLETGFWKEAYSIAEDLLRNEEQTRLAKVDALVILAKINMRRGHANVLPLLLEAKEIAVEVKELSNLIPVLVTLLEYEWLTGNRFIEKTILDSIIDTIKQKGNVYENSEFAFWLLKARNQSILLKDFFAGYQIDSQPTAVKAAALWNHLGCPYEQALALFEGSDTDKRKALEIIDKLGASAIFEKLKFLMRASGIRQIPRGIRKTTKLNAAFITERELNILQLLKEGLQNKEIAGRLFISPKTVDHHLSSIFFKLDVNSRTKAVTEAVRQEIIK